MEPNQDAGRGGRAHPRDGRLDFSTYTLSQLQDLEDTLDRDAFPRSRAALCAELGRRRAAHAAGASDPSGPAGPRPGRRHTAPQPAGPDLVRFTPHDGVRGCLHALLRRMPMYGTGSVQLRGPELLLQGTQVSWLGVPERAVKGIALEHIHNVACEHNWVRFNYRRPFLPARTVEIQTAGPAAAQRLAARLPQRMTVHSMDHWVEARELTRIIESLPGAWVTWLLMIASIAAYLVAALAGGLPQSLDELPTLNHLDAQRALDHGASMGPLTLNGEWWRLLATSLLHWTPLQVLFDLWMLWSIGRLTERLYGSGPYLMIYAVSALGAAAVSLLWNPGVISLGASGPLFGVLGAFVVFLVRHGGELPGAVWRANWLSMLALVVLGGLSVCRDTGADSAAQVGGLVAGVLCSWRLTRSLDPDARIAFPFRPALATAMLTPALLLALLWPVIPHALPPAEAYLRSHEWFTRGAEEASGRWQGLVKAESGGVISDVELQQQLKDDILPFWERSAPALEREAESLPAGQREVAALAARLARLRLTAVRETLTAGSLRDQLQRGEGSHLGREITQAEARLARVALSTTLSYRARGLAYAPPVLALRAWLSESGRRCVRPPGRSGGGADEPSQGRREAAGCAAQRLFLAGRYRRLDEAMTAAARHLGEMPDGGSVLSGIDEGLDNLFTYGALPAEDALTRTLLWQRQLPGSAVPGVVEAQILHAWAWQARGAQSPDSRSLFALRSQMAAQSLVEARSRAPQPGPAWYALSLSVGQDQAGSPPALRTLFDEGVRQFPGYLPLYRQMLRILMPRWNGSYEKIDALIRDLSESRSPADVALYARLYLTYAALEDDRVNIFSDARASWPVMKAGLQELQRRHPDSPYYLNALAKSACLAGDMQEYAALRPQVEVHPDAQAWSGRIGVASCDTRLRNYPLSASGAFSRTN